MPFVFFDDRFPDLAKRETRSITLFGGPPESLPKGEYAFLEMFCDEPGCDCRRVFFSVLCGFREEVQAVVVWGWEHPAFYARWLGSSDPDDIAVLKGPALNPGSPYTDLGPGILDSSGTSCSRMPHTSSESNAITPCSGGTLRLRPKADA